jgi:hypothetical protein
VRRTLLTGVFALAIALAAAAAGGSATRASPQVTCGQSLVIVLFWPHGHGAIRSVGFRADRSAHVEIYKYGRKGYPRKNFLVYANGQGRTRFAGSCVSAGGPHPNGPILQRLTAHKARALSCRLPATAVMRMRRVADRFQIDIGSPDARVVSAKLRVRGSAVDYSRASCNAGPAPR